MPAALYFTDDPEACELLARDPFALLVGFAIDQQVTVQKAFSSPLELSKRIGALDAKKIAAMDPQVLEDAFREKPALHRFPGSMAKRTHALCRSLVDHYGGDAAAVWTGASSGAELLERVKALPGFGEEKSQIFVALLAKRFGVRPPGWEQAAGVFADGEPRTIADCHDPESLARVREWKRTQREAKKDKQGRDLAERAG